jgi:cytochrome c oxidase subunit 2
MEPTAYEAWLSGNVVSTSLAARGERLFGDLACNTCHLTDGRGRGPSLADKFGAAERLANGVTVAIDEAYVRESILTPQAKVVEGYQPLMPTFQGLVSEENVMALVEYVKSLRAPSGAVSRVEAPEEPASPPAAPQENR